MELLDLGLKNYLYTMIKEEFDKRGYRFFTEPYSMNIYAIRNKTQAPNKFNDILGVAYSNGLTTVQCEFPATVDPGTNWLVNPMDRGGAAAIVPGQYLALWKLGTFKGTRALIQIRPIKVYRDNNRNEVFDYNPRDITEGMYGIFLHQHFQGIDIASIVGTSSAGCVVPQRLVDWKYFFDVIELQRENGLGDTYTFTLFE